jgi:P27 family predicted phage terminase small subunit
VTRKTTSTSAPPECLDDEGRRKWCEVFPLLEARGDVDQAALDGLLCYCSAFAEMRAARAQVEKLGSVIKSAAGFAIVSPYVTVAAQAERRLRQWAAELRLTPKSKSKSAGKGSTPTRPAKTSTPNPLQSLRLRAQ